MEFFILIQILKNILKANSGEPDHAPRFCGVSSGSALFICVPQKEVIGAYGFREL